VERANSASPKPSPPKAVGVVAAYAQPVQLRVRPPCEHPIRGAQVVVGDLVIAALDVHHQEATDLLGFDLVAYVPLVELLAAASDLFCCESWIGIAVPPYASVLCKLPSAYFDACIPPKKMVTWHMQILQRMSTWQRARPSHPDSLCLRRGKQPT
jgi:hypothetical protein